MTLLLRSINSVTTAVCLSKEQMAFYNIVRKKFSLEPIQNAVPHLSFHQGA